MATFQGVEVEFVRDYDAVIDVETWRAQRADNHQQIYLWDLDPSTGGFFNGFPALAPTSEEVEQMLKDYVILEFE